MTCYRPQRALQVFNSRGEHHRMRIFHPDRRDPDGLRHWYAPAPRSMSHIHGGERLGSQKALTLPCGLCFGCRCDNARSWSLRMMHETRYHAHNYFITLTYAPEHMPLNGMLNYSHLTKFFKRARHSFQTAAKPFKYFACGEYGDKTLRPHFHFAGFDFVLDDLRFFKKTPNGGAYFLSEALRDCWRYGHVIVAPLEWDSAAYIARYVTKKMHGKGIRDWVDPDTGECFPFPVEKPFMSKGLGLPFYNQHKDEIWDLDGCLYKQQYLIKPPRYYFKELVKEDPWKAMAIQSAREKSHELLTLDTARDRELLYAMQAKKLAMQTLQRSL